jgi:hypothetical protein
MDYQELTDNAPSTKFSPLFLATPPRPHYLDTRLQFSVFLHLPSKFLLARQLVHVTLANELFRNANCIKDSIYLVTVKTVIRFNLFLLERVLLICSLFLSTFNSTGAFTCMQDSDCKNRCKIVDKSVHLDVRMFYVCGTKCFVMSHCKRQEIVKNRNM